MNIKKNSILSYHISIQYYRKKIGFSGSGWVILPEPEPEPENPKKSGTQPEPEPDLPEKIGYSTRTRPDLPEKIGFVKFYFYYFMSFCIHFIQFHCV